MAVDVKVRDLELVVLVSETLNLHAVADALGLSQPAVTKRLRILERHVRARLFERDNAKVVLTDHGRHFVRHARSSVESYRRAIAGMRDLADEAPILRVGKSPFVDQNLASHLSAVFLSNYPEMRIDLEADFSCDLIRSLQQKTIDVALVLSPQTTGKISQIALRREPFQVAFRDGHPLAAARAVSIADIAQFPWVLFSRRAHPPLFDRIVDRADDMGLSYRIVHSFLHPEEALPHLASSDAVVWLTPNAAGNFVYRGAQMRPLCDDALFLETFIASRAEDRSPIVSEFVRAFVDAIRPISSPQTATDALACSECEQAMFTHIIKGQFMETTF